MADNFSGQLNLVPTFPVADGVSGTLSNLKHASYINLYVYGQNNTSVQVQGVKTLSVHEEHAGFSLEFFAGSRRPEPKKGTRMFTMSLTRAQFGLAPLKELIRHCYTKPSSGTDIYLVDYPVRAMIQYLEVNNDYSQVINLETATYDELYFNDLTVDHVTAADGYVTETATALTAYEAITASTTGKSFSIVTQPASQGFWSK